MLASTLLLLALTSSITQAEDITAEEPQEMTFGTQDSYNDLKEGWDKCDVLSITTKWFEWITTFTGPEAEKCKYSLAFTQQVTAQGSGGKWFRAQLADPDDTTKALNKTVIYVEPTLTGGTHRIRLCLGKPRNEDTCQGVTAKSGCIAFDVSQWKDTSNVQSNGIIDVNVHVRVKCKDEGCSNSDNGPKIFMAALYRKSTCSAPSAQPPPPGER